MVSPRTDRRGASRLGCLVMLALLGGGLYYGLPVGHIYMRFFEMQDEMHQQAQFADQLTDEAIRQRLLARADSLGIPTPTLRIDRSLRPSRITIEGHYTESVELPKFRHTFDLRPRAEEPL
jgi:hypothetical protein